MSEIQQRQMRLVMLCALGLSTLAGSAAQAGGLLLYEIGTADVSLAAAGYTARAQDAGTVFTNPAGMTRLEGDQITLGLQALYGRASFNIDPSATSPRLGSDSGGNAIGWFPGGGFFYSHSISPDLKVGMALTGNFGLSIKYNDAWAGRYYTRESTLLGISFVPAVAYRVNDKLSLGASVNAMRGSFKTKVAVNNLLAPDGQLELDDNVWGVGGNLGLLYELTPGTRVGLTYNSQIKLDFDAQPKWSGVGPLLGAGLRLSGLDSANVDLGMTVPQGVNLGVYHEIDPQWALLGSVGWQQWSKFGEVDVGVSSNNPVSVTANRNYKDTWHVAAGAQYRASERYMFMGGIAYDSEFQDSNAIPPAIPANAAWRFGLGTQITESKAFNWGVSLEYVYAGTLNTNMSGGLRGNLAGSYDQPAGIFFMAANLNYRF
jgi:long-chain fatty acid transport protein